MSLAEWVIVAGLVVYVLGAFTYNYSQRRRRRQREARRFEHMEDR